MVTPVEARVGGPPVEVRVAGVLVPATDVGPLTMRHGRDDVDEAPTAGTASTVLDAAAATTALGRFPAVGDTFTVDVAPAAVAVLGVTGSPRRFTGRVTDLTVRLDPGAPTLVAVTAAGHRARLGAVAVTPVGWPAELDGARAARVLAAATAADPLLAAAPAGEQGPGTVRVLAADEPTTPALRVLDELADSAGGTLVERRDGRLVYRDAAGRSATPRVILAARDVLAGAEWTSSTRALLTAATVSYGTPVAGGSQPSTRAVDAVAAGAFGPVEARLETVLADLAAADSRALELVGRRSRPRWAVSDVTVELTRLVDPLTAGRLLDLEQGDLIGVAGWASDGPVTRARVWVEGWTEHVARDEWRLTLAVVAYGQASTPPRYVDVPPRTLGGLTTADRSYATGHAWTSTQGPDSGAHQTTGTTLAQTAVTGGVRVTAGTSSQAVQHRRGFTTAPLVAHAGRRLVVAHTVTAPVGVGVRPAIVLRTSTGALSSVYGPVMTIGGLGSVRVELAHTLPDPTSATGWYPALTVGVGGTRGLAAGDAVTFTNADAGVVQDPGVTYATAPTDLAYLGALGWDPGEVDLGRYVDVPTDRRYATAAGTYHDAETGVT